ncbi:MAG: hypothetical protein C0421_01125 [Hyphomonas sp.]|uniref:hypothetical protein n=1 Tax=Hyphomonas sp. TaxID=87 RepID=UPI0025BB1E67|nr:hypothetical protein [Hyphomonas sp.]MBA4337432.1 hypothetical protein [Hyphomonas sp.]
MMRCAISFGLLAMVLAGPALANGKVDVASCKAMQATLAPREAEISELTGQREAAALRAEEAGIAWEDAEIHRLVSAAHAATADRELAAYDAAKKKFARDELALRSAVLQFNTDVAVYNARCSPKG